MIKVNDKLQIVGIRETRDTVVTGLEMFNKLLDEARAGENVGILLRGAEKKDIERGMVLAAPGTCTPHTKFKGTIYVLTKEEGGRHKPFFTGYRPQFYFRTTDVTGTVTLPTGTEMVMPGDNVELDSGTHPSDCDGRRNEICDPRRRKNDRRRNCDENRQVTNSGF